MPGGQYIALSALRVRMDQLDRLAIDLANVGTAGYRGARSSQVAAHREQFDHVLDAAVDITAGAARMDMSAGTIAPTGRPLDVAIEGEGFFVLQTPTGLQYTRNGHFQRSLDGSLVSADGSLVMGEDGPLVLGPGEARIDEQGGVWGLEGRVGQLKFARVADPGAMQRGEGAALLASGLVVADAEDVRVKSGVLEQSNVAVSEGLARLTTVARSFEALQRAISTILNDVDGRLIDNIARR